MSRRTIFILSFAVPLAIVPLVLMSAGVRFPTALLVSGITFVFLIPPIRSVFRLAEERQGSTIPPLWPDRPAGLLLLFGVCPIVVGVITYVGYPHTLATTIVNLAILFAASLWFYRR